jgi:hypothetical protein
MNVWLIAAEHEVDARSDYRQLVVVEAPDVICQHEAVHGGDL